MEIIDKVYKIIDERQKRSENKCGTSQSYVQEMMNLDKETLKPFLVELHKRKKIIVRKGVNGHLIFLNNFKTTTN